MSNLFYVYDLDIDQYLSKDNPYLKRVMSLAKKFFSYSQNC